MKASPGRNEPSTLPGRLLLGLALLGMTPPDLLAEDDRAKGLPPRIERVLRWLPEDTETLVVARSVTLPEPERDGDPNWQDAGVGLAIGEGLDREGGRLLKPLRGRKIECVAFGAKDFQVVSSFGSLRSESCSILVFEDDLGDAAGRWTGWLRGQAKAVRTLIGREVFVFPPTTVMEPWVKETKWQGTYLVLLRPNVVLCASSDRYLESVLRRVDEAPRARALPDDLAEWKQVDLDASAWMLRHRPRVGRGIRTVGATVAFMKDGFRVVYVPRAGSDQNLGSLRKSWEGWLPGRGPDDHGLRDRLEIGRRSDGTVVVSFGGKPDEVPGFGFPLYGLLGMELAEPDD